MTTKNSSIVAGVFSNEKNAQQAMADLQKARFTDDQIRYSVHKGGKGILDSLLDLGFGQEEATYYNREFLAGRTIVTVMNSDHQQEAADILQRNGASDASRRTSQAAPTATTESTSGTEQTFQLHEERLSATTQQVQAGEVDIHKEVVSEQQTLSVPITHEEVYIERHAVSGAGASSSDTPFDFSQQEEDIRVPVSAEQVRVGKQTVVREELEVGKRTVQENQRVTDTVRHEEAHIEREGDVHMEGDDLADPTTRQDANR